MPTRSETALAVIALVAAGVITLQSGLLPALALTAAAIVVVVVPGYLLSAMFVRFGGVDGVVRLAMTLGLGLTTVVLGGLLLQVTPFGISLIGWLALVVLAVLGAGLWWQPRGFAPERLGVIATQASTFRPNPGQIALLSVAVALTCTSVAVSRASENALRAPNVTQLWTQPAATGEPGAIDVLVRNLEGSDQEYRIEAWIGSDEMGTWHTNLPNGERWSITVTPPAESDGERLEVQLFLDSSETVYRELEIQL